MSILKTHKEGSFVEQSCQTLVLLSLEQPSRIVGTLGRSVGDRSIPRINGRRDRDRLALSVGDVSKPLDDLECSVKVRLGDKVRSTVSSHDLGSSKLKVGSVDFSSENFVESLSSSKNHGVTLHLDRSLTQSNEVGSNTDGSSGNQRDGEDALIVGSGGSSSDETRSSKGFNTLQFQRIE